MVDVLRWARHLLDAERAAVSVSPITNSVPTLTLEEAYEIQAAVVMEKQASGCEVVGAKLAVVPGDVGGLRNLVAGILLADNIHCREAPLFVKSLISPHVAPGIVFKLGQDLRGPGVTAIDVLGATAGVCAALEVTDSRFGERAASVCDIAADNASGSRLVLGAIMKPAASIDLDLIGVLFEHGAALHATAAGAAVPCNPSGAVAALANLLATTGGHLHAGWLVYSGSLTAAVSVVPPTHLRATFAHLGSLGIEVV